MTQPITYDLAKGQQQLDRLRNDFGYFVRALWADRGYDQPGKAPLSDIELDIADWLANGDKTRSSRLRGALAARGLGKALAIDTPIPVPEGWKCMGDLVVGDKVFDEDGRTCNVVATTETMVGNACYSVGFSDGTSIIADARHSWAVTDRSRKHPFVGMTEIAKTVQMSGRVWIEPRRGSGDIRSPRFFVPRTNEHDQRAIVHIRRVTSVPVRCIQVDSPSRLFLAGEGKVPTHNSHLIAALVCYRLYRDPERKIIVVSKAKDHARNVVSMIRRWLKTVWFLEHLRPGEGQTDTENRLQVGPARPSVQASLTAMGIDGSLEGNRAHSIYPDDIETDINTQMPETRKWLLERCGEFEDILYPDSPELIDQTECVVIGTFHHDTDSVYMNLERQNYVFRTWPLCSPMRTDKFLNLAPVIAQGLASGKYRYTVDEHYEDNPLLGHRFDRANILSKRSSRVRFNMQHMLKVNSTDAATYPLRLSDLIVMPVHRDKAPLTVTHGKSGAKGSTKLVNVANLGIGEDCLYGPVSVDTVVSPYTRNIGYVDPAGRGDRTGLCCIGILNGLFFVKGLYGLDGSKEDNLIGKIAELFRHHGVREAWCETNNDPNNTYIPAIESELRKYFVDQGDPVYPDGWRCSITKDHVSKQKELRILSVVEPTVSQHRLIFDTAAITPVPDESMEQCFQFQFSRLTKERKSLEEDAMIDALASCIRKGSEAMSVDPNANRPNQMESDYDNDRKSLARLKARAMGQAPRAPRWYTPRWMKN